MKPGDYVVCEVQKATWTQSKPDPSASPVCGAAVVNTASGGGYAETLVSGQDRQNVDFGNYRDATIEVTKYHDKDANGSRTLADEPVLANWDFFIDKNGNSTKDADEPAVPTDRRGRQGEPLGEAGLASHRLRGPEDRLAQLGARGNGDTDPRYTLLAADLESGEKVERVFGNYQDAKLSGVKFEDKDADGTLDGGETGPAASFDVKIFRDNGTQPGELDSGDTLVDTVAMTAGTGAWSKAGLKPDSYIVCEVQKADWHQSKPDPSASPVCGPARSGRPERRRVCGDAHIGRKTA